MIYFTYLSEQVCIDLVDVDCEHLPPVGRRARHPGHRAWKTKISLNRKRSYFNPLFRPLTRRHGLGGTPSGSPCEGLGGGGDAVVGDAGHGAGDLRHDDLGTYETG